MRVFFHTGAGKTGTSAIQVALAGMRTELASHNIWYPKGHGNSDDRASKGKTSSGNAVALGHWLVPPRRQPEFDLGAIKGWLDNNIAAAAGRDLLFSSETMQVPRPEMVEQLCAFFASKGYQPTLVFYVRHMLDQAVATYLQHLKRGFASMPNLANVDLGSFLRKFQCTYVASIEPFAKLLPDDRIVVRLYDDESSSLIEKFLAIFTEAKLTIPAGDRVVNRSPTTAEQKMFQILARMNDGSRLCRLVADILLDRPGARERLCVSEDDFAGFEKNNRRNLDTINEKYLRNGSVLKMKSDKIDVGPVPVVEAEKVFDAFASSIAFLEEDFAARRRAERVERAERVGGRGAAGAAKGPTAKVAV